MNVPFIKNSIHVLDTIYLFPANVKFNLNTINTDEWADKKWHLTV